MDPRSKIQDKIQGLRIGSPKSLAQNPKENTLDV